MLDEIDWGSLSHAYGPATDTAAHLAALTSANPDARQAALDHLDAAVLHQGFPASATAPAAHVVAGLLARGEADPEVRDGLIEFLGEVAAATSTAAGDPYSEDLLAPLQRAIQESYPVVVGFLDHHDRWVRKRAVEAAISHARTQVLAEQRPILAARLRIWADDPSEERAYWVRRLGELDIDTEQYLTDPDAEVRVCAALAPGLGDNPAATDIIVAALVHAADHGIADPALYRLGEIVAAALVRVADFERIAAPAETIIRHADWTGFDRTWGPLLLAAFDTPYDEHIEPSATQRRILTALVDNPLVWNHRIGNSLSVFRRAGLPFEREACARIAGEV
ncbi:hypothetical protein IU438_21690 [Nocardia cyriacigeorgica]|nr:hypothetical protein [Nocardia cyriacigeorgica]MBF6398400.1 hypothetical protein [Nocardia cyriacigeorgica]MBF6404086.1 hypothetical protein [Nocardia cyriacigeorgica]